MTPDGPAKALGRWSLEAIFSVFSVDSIYDNAILSRAVSKMSRQPGRMWLGLCWYDIRHRLARQPKYNEQTPGRLRVAILATLSKGHSGVSDQKRLLRMLVNVESLE